MASRAETPIAVLLLLLLETDVKLPGVLDRLCDTVISLPCNQFLLARIFIPRAAAPAAAATDRLLLVCEPLPGAQSNRRSFCVDGLRAMPREAVTACEVATALLISGAPHEAL